MDTIKSRLRIKPVIWMPSLAIILLAMDCHQCDESFLSFLLGTLILSVTLVATLLFGSFLRLKKIGTPTKVADLTSYTVVIIGGIWALLRLLNVGLVGYSIACMDGFVLGGLLGSLHLRQTHLRANQSTGSADEK